MKFVVTTLEGMEQVCADEIKSHNIIVDSIGKRAVICEGTWTHLYKANYLLRTAVRVLLPLKTFTITTQDDLYDAVRSIEWSGYINEEATIAVTSTVRSEIFSNSQFVTFRTKDAIVDQLMDLRGERPSVDLDNPTVRIHIRLNDNELTVSLDSSGGSLHLRGYKIRQFKAPLNEVLAASIIRLSGWDGIKEMIDPMSGSGTFTTEALMFAANIPAGYFKENKYGFQGWPEYHEKIWDLVKETSDNKIKSPETIIHSSDLNRFAVRDLRKNLQRFPFKDKVIIKNVDFFTIRGQKQKILYFNPPYEIRIKTGNIGSLYEKMGDQLKQYWQDSEAWVISGNPEAMKHFGLKPSSKYTLDNGGIESKLFKFEMYGGSKKSKYTTNNSNRNKSNFRDRDRKPYRGPQKDNYRPRRDERS